MLIDPDNVSKEFLKAEKIVQRDPLPPAVRGDAVERVTKLKHQAPDSEAQLFDDLLEALLVARS